MADVFISFSSKDAEPVGRIHSRLMESGFEVWWMRSLSPGESAIRTVSRELVAATNVVVAWSRHAEESPYVEGEIMYAFGQRKLLPVRIEKWNWPPFLSSVQYIDLTPLDDEAEAWRLIETRLRHGAGGDSEPLSATYVAVPRSAGPVRARALMILILLVALASLLTTAAGAVRDGDVQMLQALQFVVLGLLVVSGAMVVDAARRVWKVWRTRPTGEASKS
jgi:TIR domain